MHEHTVIEQEEMVRIYYCEANANLQKAVEIYNSSIEKLGIQGVKLLTEKNLNLIISIFEWNGRFKHYVRKKKLKKSYSSSLAQKIQKYVKDHPGCSSWNAAQHFGISYSFYKNIFSILPESSQPKKQMSIGSELPLVCTTRLDDMTVLRKEEDIVENNDNLLEDIEAESKPTFDAERVSRKRKFPAYKEYYLLKNKLKSQIECKQKKKRQLLSSTIEKALSKLKDLKSENVLTKSKHADIIIDLDSLEEDKIITNYSCDDFLMNGFRIEPLTVISSVKGSAIFSANAPTLLIRLKDMDQKEILDSCRSIFSCAPKTTVHKCCWYKLNSSKGVQRWPTFFHTCHEKSCDCCCRTNSPTPITDDSDYIKEIRFKKNEIFNLKTVRSMYNILKWKRKSSDIIGKALDFVKKPPTITPFKQKTTPESSIVDTSIYFMKNKKHKVEIYTFDAYGTVVEYCVTNPHLYPRTIEMKNTFLGLHMTLAKNVTPITNCCWQKHNRIMTDLKTMMCPPEIINFMKQPHMCASNCECCCVFLCQKMNIYYFPKLKNINREVKLLSEFKKNTANATINTEKPKTISNSTIDHNVNLTRSNNKTKPEMFTIIIPDMNKKKNNNNPTANATINAEKPETISNKTIDHNVNLTRSNNKTDADTQTFSIIIPDMNKKKNNKTPIPKFNVNHNPPYRQKYRTVGGNTCPRVKKRAAIVKNKSTTPANSSTPQKIAPKPVENSRGSTTPANSSTPQKIAPNPVENSRGSQINFETVVFGNTIPGFPAINTSLPLTLILPLIKNSIKEVPGAASYSFSICKTFEDLVLTIDNNGKVTASLKQPVTSFSTLELRVLSNILCKAQKAFNKTLKVPDKSMPNLEPNDNDTDADKTKQINIIQKSDIFRDACQKLLLKSGIYKHCLQNYTVSSKNSIGPIIDNYFSIKDEPHIDFVESVDPTPGPSGTQTSDEIYGDEGDIPESIDHKDLNTFIKEETVLMLPSQSNITLPVLMEQAHRLPNVPPVMLNTSFPQNSTFLPVVRHTQNSEASHVLIPTNGPPNLAPILQNQVLQQDKNLLRKAAIVDDIINTDELCPDTSLSQMENDEIRLTGINQWHLPEIENDPIRIIENVDENLENEDEDIKDEEIEIIDDEIDVKEELEVEEECILGA